MNPGDDVTCTLESKLYVGTVTCVEWRIDGYDGLGISQVSYLFTTVCFRV